MSVLFSQSSYHIHFSSRNSQIARYAKRNVCAHVFNNVYRNGSRKPNGNSNSTGARKTLRILIYSGVSPAEYLIGAGLFTLILSTAGGIAFGLLMGLTIAQFFCFLAVFTLGGTASIVIGSAIGLFAKNQISAPAIIMPIALVMAFMHICLPQGRPCRIKLKNPPI